MENKEEGEKIARQGDNYSQEKPKRGIKKEDRLGSLGIKGKSRRETSLGDKATAAAKRSPEGKS